MTRRFKSLAPLVGALLAIGALMASSAGASAFTAEQAPVTFVGTPHGSYNVQATGLSVECESVELHGEVEETSVEQVSLTPVLEECTAFGFINAKITGFGNYGEEQTCQLVVHAEGTGDLACEEGAEVTLVSGTCTVHLPSQSGLEGFAFTEVEEEGVSALTVDINLTELTGTHTDAFLCPFNGSGEFSGTTAQGVGLVAGEDPSTGEPVGITWDE